MSSTPSALLLLLLLAIATPAHALSDPSEMLSNKREEARAEVLGRQLRCLVCQNESIEDSGADLARDLRGIVRQRAAAGESDKQIIGWMVSRYGQFVLLQPRFDWLTLLLWGSPVVALVAGGATVFLARQRDRRPPPPLSYEERVRLDDLTRPIA
ncbi:MAG TPA: cytochrome c-type biogenesis protein [Acetobacteraceae bacterium]|jgi:cytochrome c-type biogenesis protein CcmH